MILRGKDKVIYIPDPAITNASIDCACHCEVASTVAISLEKAGLLRFISNDILIAGFGYILSNMVYKKLF
jgi:hypothetical protein